MNQSIHSGNTSSLPTKHTLIQLPRSKALSSESVEPVMTLKTYRRGRNLRVFESMLLDGLIGGKMR